MDRILEVINASDLSRIHSLLAIVGSLLAVYVMSVTSYEHEDRDDPVWLQHLRRIGLFALAIAFGWSFLYLHDKNWKPWPPEVLLMVGIIMGLAVRAVAIHLRIRREGRRIPNFGSHMLRAHSRSDRGNIVR